MTPRRAPAWRRYLRFWGSNLPQDVEEELRFHFEMRVNEYIAAGMSPDAARQRAAQRVGNLDRAREECVVIHEAHARTEAKAELVQTARQDFAFALRLLRRQALPSIVAVLCLALGIGATTTMFSVGSTLLLRPLPFPNADRVVTVSSARLSNKQVSTITSYPDFVDWRTRSRSFTDMAALEQSNLTFVLSTPLRANGGRVSGGFFQTFGVQPEAGRVFTADDDRPGAPKVLVVSHSFAEQSLGGAATVVGKQFLVAGEKQTIVGVIPDVMRIPSNAQVWAPMQRDYARSSRGNRSMNVFGLIKPGFTIEAATKELTALSEQIGKEQQKGDAYIVGALTPLRERYVGSSRSGLWALSAATILMLLVACTNVAALQMARATSRAREIAVRSAVGAGRTRLVRQLLTENVVLAVVGGALGIAVALISMKYVARSIAPAVPSWMSFSIDAGALAFTLAISTLVGIVFGMAPALRLSRVDPNTVLRGGTGALGWTRGRLQRGFVAAEIALSVVLVIGALLAIQSVSRLQNVPLGIDPSGVVSFRMTMQGPRYQEEPPRAELLRAFEERIAAIPGVEAVGATTYVPIVGCCSQFGTQIAGRETDAAHMLMVTGNLITPGFFRSVRIPLLAGREFTDADKAGAPKVVIINETFAKRYWPAGDAVGHNIDTGSGMAMIVGVVGDIKQARIQDGPEPQFYRPHAQDPWEGMTITVRVRGDNPARVMPDVQRAIRELDATMPVYGVQTLEKILADVIDSHRVFGILLAAFALVALTLATAGVYATMSFFVSQRTRELGLRVALGAESARVIRHVMQQGAVMAIGGGLVGVIGGIAAARALAHSLYGVSASDPLLYVVGASTLVLAAIGASYGPARRASGVDPMVALRSE
jgi:putative ABC transport system permease protein